MTIKLLKSSELLEKIGKVGTLVKDFQSAFNAGGLVHETACECLLHIYKHGDVMPAQRLYEACGGAVNRSLRTATDRKTLVKAEAVALWFLQMSGKQITVRKNPAGDFNWAMTDKWNRSEELWNKLLEAAEQTPIMEYAQEERQIIRPVYAGQVLNQIDNFIDRVTKSITEEQPNFQGDPEITMRILGQVSEYAHKLFDQEDARNLGMAKQGNVIPFKEKTAEGDKLIRNGEEVTEEEVVGQQEQRAAVG